MFRKKWWVVQTNLYFVSHAEETRELIGPFRFKRHAETLALHCANQALRMNWKHEYLVVRKGETTNYGIDIAEDIADAVELERAVKNDDHRRFSIAEVIADIFD